MYAIIKLLVKKEVFIMAYFLNNDFKNNEFELVSKDKFFVDKTRLIEKNKFFNRYQRPIRVYNTSTSFWKNSKCYDASFILF